MATASSGAIPMREKRSTAATSGALSLPPTSTGQLAGMKSIWLLVRRLDLAEGTKQLVMLREIVVPDNCSPDVMQQLLRQELQLGDLKVVFKLKNHRGSLIIPKGSIPANTKTMPYSLDIYGIHQTVKPKEKSVNFPEYEEVLKTTLEGFVTRVTRMENDLPDLNRKKELKLERDLQEMDKKLAFLQKRFAEAERSKWEGNLKKNPFW